jgi:filamentous hemagglutinin family protein
MIKMCANLLRHGSMMFVSLLTWQFCQFRAVANPTGGTVTQGSAGIAGGGTSQLTVTQTSPYAAINWQSFNIGAGETTTFVQPSSSSVIWNQINDSNPSQILGNLNANGYVVLQNQNGFVVGGQAAITAHGLVLTTASTPNLSLSSGAWEFDAPAPTAKIINYGQINITGGGSAFLIADDIENDNSQGQGTISAPGGKIGLYAGQKVLVSTSPDGRGLSAELTLPQGSVNNQGQLVADGGSIMAQAQTVNQGGLIQANTVQNVNGTIELLASDSVNLGAISAISAQGAASGTSAGGSVTIQSQNNFSDQAGSVINVSGGAQGGAGGEISIAAPQMSALHSSLSGQATAGYVNGSLAVDTDGILLNSDGSAASGVLALNVNSLASGFSQIDLTSANNIEVNALWDLAAKNGVVGVVSLIAANLITVDAGAEIESDSGRIALNAKTVDEYGTLQANSINNANGVVELDANAINLGANAVISAAGTTAANPGGFVVLNSTGAYSDTATTELNVSGSGTGQGGILEVLGAGAVHAKVGSPFLELVNPYDLYLSSNPTTLPVNPSSENIALTDLSGYSQIDLHALDNITLGSSSGTGTQWNPASSLLALSLTAGNNIVFDASYNSSQKVNTSSILNLSAVAPGSGQLNLSAGNDIDLDSITINNGSASAASDIQAGSGWNVNLSAGTAFVPTAGQPKPASGADGIYLNGAAYIQTQNGNIDLWAANDVEVGWSGAFSPTVVNAGTGRITTELGGNISVTTVYGDINTGSDVNGFLFGQKTAPYYKVNPLVGGISTVAGGNVSLAAGNNVISYLPQQTDYNHAKNDAGSGAFGPEAGNVTITAGGNIYGHFVVANGVGTVTAGGNIGAPLSTLSSVPNEGFALSLISGSWNVYAPNGSIYIQDVRNPNGIFGEPNAQSSPSSYTGYHVFDYNPLDSVLLDAGDAVEVTGYNDPNTPPSNTGSAIPELFPPSLTVDAGAGGFILDTSLTLFPSPDQSLNITTVDGGNFGIPNSQNPYQNIVPVNLLMSDSASQQWVGSDSFAIGDDTSTLPAMDNTTPNEISISGSINAVDLYTTKATKITVGGDMINSGFSGQNLQASDVTSINVKGKIFNSPVDSFVELTSGIISANPQQPNVWDSVFDLALTPTAAAALANFNVSTLTAGSLTLAQYLKQNGYLLFPGASSDTTVYGANPGFIYDANSQILGFQGVMSQKLTTAQIMALEGGSITVLAADSHGAPLVVNGQLQFITYTFSAAPLIATLDTESLQSSYNPDPTATGPGYQIGGPGQFNVSAGSINLGNAPGISSVGFDGHPSLVSLLPTAAEGGASVTVDVAGDLNMITSSIYSEDGGNVTVNAGGAINLSEGTTVVSGDTTISKYFDFKTVLPYGIYTAGHSDVTVTANEDINIGSSRIATFNGGNVYVESYYGNVNAGSGVNEAVNVQGVDYDAAGTPQVLQFGDTTDPTTVLDNPPPYGSGILAEMVIPQYQTGGVNQPGDITVITHNGNIISDRGGISQFVLNGTVDGPTVTLIAGIAGVTSPSDPNVGNIDLGAGGVLGGGVNVEGTGKINGYFISSQNLNVTAQSFSGLGLAGQTANVSASEPSSGPAIIVGIGAVVANGLGGAATLLGQNVSANGGSAQSTLGSSVNASAASQSAAGATSAESKEQVASNDNDSGDDLKKKKHPVLQHIKRVTVILPKST